MYLQTQQLHNIYNKRCIANDFLLSERLYTNNNEYLVKVVIMLSLISVPFYLSISKLAKSH